MSKSISDILETFSLDVKSRAKSWDENVALEAIITHGLRVAIANYERRIHITGVGKNAHIAAKASETFASLGIPSMYLNTSHLTHGDFGFIGGDDIVIHLSRSGKTDEMIHAAKHLKKIKPTVAQYLLTCQDPGSLPDAENIFVIAYLGKAVEFDANQLAPTTSTLLMLLALDCIGTKISNMIQFTRAEFLAYHPGGALGSMLRSEKNEEKKDDKHYWEQTSLHQNNDHWQCCDCKQLIGCLTEEKRNEVCPAKIPQDDK